VSALFIGELPVDPKVGGGAFGLELEKEFRGRTLDRTEVPGLFAHEEADGTVEDRVGLVAWGFDDGPSLKM
jgi:hypothetical protein